MVPRLHLKQFFWGHRITVCVCLCLCIQAHLESREAQMATAVEEERLKNVQLQEQHRQLSKRYDSLQKAIKDGETTQTQLNQRLRTSKEKLTKLTALNKRLLAQQCKQRDTLEQKQKSLAEEKAQILAGLDQEQAALEEQLRDLNFYLTTQKTIAKNPMKDEIAQGHMIMTSESPGEGRKKKGGRKKKR